MGDFFETEDVNLEHFLEIFFHSNVLVIEVLFGVVLAGAIFLTIRSFSRPEDSNTGVNLQSLEEGIKKILENHSPGAKATVGAGDASETENSSVVEELSTQVERLKIQLMQKSEEVEQLKASAGAGPSSTSIQAQDAGASAESPVVTAGGSGASGNSAELEEKIRDLEARLSEYSIIEDDIADLSFYKEETVRLQAEVDQLKARLAEYESGGAPSAAVPDRPTKDEPMAPQEKSVASEAIPLVEDTPSPVEAVPPPADVDVTSSSETSVDDDIMAEFERAVAEQKAMTVGEKVATAVPADANDENVSAVPETPATDDALKEGINIDKMMNEVNALPEQESESTINALEQALDTEKLLQEATGMGKLDTEALNEFDEFIKKEGA